MFVSVVLTGSKHRNKPRNLCVSFMKQTEKQPKHCKSVLFGFFNSWTSFYERLIKSCIDVGKRSAVTVINTLWCNTYVSIYQESTKYTQLGYLILINNINLQWCYL
jgi:hypothetical protein